MFIGLLISFYYEQKSYFFLFLLGPLIFLIYIFSYTTLLQCPPVLLLYLLIVSTCIFVLILQQILTTWSCSLARTSPSMVRHISLLKSARPRFRGGGGIALLRLLLTSLPPFRPPPPPFRPSPLCFPPPPPPTPFFSVRPPMSFLKIPLFGSQHPSVPPPFRPLSPFGARVQSAGGGLLESLRCMADTAQSNGCQPVSLIVVFALWLC